MTAAPRDDKAAQEGEDFDYYMPLWGGRFKAVPTGKLELFGASLTFDKRLWREDIRGSKAHARMLARQGVISQAEAANITEGLDAIAAQIRSGNFALDPEVDEDIHMAIERVLTLNIGEDGGRLHTGRSRNDQSVLDTRLGARFFAHKLQSEIVRLQEALLGRAQQHFGVVMPGYTHLQPAQPVLFSHHLLAYFWMFARDFARLEAAAAAANVSPLGAAALAGTTYPLDREAVAEDLGMDGVIPNSMDAVSDRDFVCDLIYACALCQVHLSRLCEELVLWSSAEFGFVTMDDTHATGSSIMPQKKNPDFAELTRGKVGRVYGSLMGLLTTMKGIPLAYNKDLQECKEGAIDAFDTLRDAMICMEGMIDTWTVHDDVMREEAALGFTAATDVADYLAKRGVPFRKAHEIVGELVLYCEKKHKGLEDLTLKEFRKASPYFSEDIVGELDPEAIARARTTYGGTGHDAVRLQLKEAGTALRRDRNRVKAIRERGGVIE